MISPADAAQLFRALSFLAMLGLAALILLG